MKSFAAAAVLLTLASTAAAAPANSLPVIQPSPVVERGNKYLPVISPSPIVERADLPVVTPTPAKEAEQPHATLGYPLPDDGTTCEQITLGGNGKAGQTSLEGKCTNAKGEWWKTTINLNRCITNVGGKLEYMPDGHFDTSCRPCTIDTVPGGAEINLKCNCLDWDEVPKFTYLEMGDRVDSSLGVKLVNGVFVCGEVVGTKGPLL